MPRARRRRLGAASAHRARERVDARAPGSASSSAARPPPARHASRARRRRARRCARAMATSCSGRLARAVDDLGEALAQRAMMVDRREAERLGRLVRQRGERRRRSAASRPRPCASRSRTRSRLTPPSASSESIVVVAVRRPRRANRSCVRRGSRRRSLRPRRTTSRRTAACRSSAPPCSPLAYQPRCLRNSIAAPRGSVSYSITMRAWSSAIGEALLDRRRRRASAGPRAGPSPGRRSTAARTSRARS